MKKSNLVILCILDGWGYRENGADNAIAMASTPCWDKTIKHYPQSLLATSGLDVGLPEGQMGNSEVGHMNIGSGRVVMQDLPRIDKAVADGSLASNPEFISMIKGLKQSGGVCHLMGLLSDGGVHAHQAHITAMAKHVAEQGIQVYLHLFLDGRDTPPSSSLGYVEKLLADIEEIDTIDIATLGGRYYGMDRDNRWERIKQAYDAMLLGKGEKATGPIAAITSYHQQEIFDEFIPPTVIGDYKGMSDGDAILMANYRADRVRQILAAIVDPKFDGFDRSNNIQFSSVICMTEYAASLTPYVHILFPPQKLTKLLGEVIAEEGKKQLRIAETEKYAHVTFFFNGGREEEYPGEKRILIPSPKVATYDLQPAMSAPEVTEGVLSEIDNMDLIIVNYANTDMVGHTGDFEAAKQAVEVIDGCIAKLEQAVIERDGVLFITADHGNAEQMINEKTGEPFTSHTTNPVPFICCTKQADSIKLHDGRLSDIAPTILDVMGIKIPAEMTGKSLLKNN